MGRRKMFIFHVKLVHTDREVQIDGWSTVKQYTLMVPCGGIKTHTGQPCSVKRGDTEFAQADMGQNF